MSKSPIQNLELIEFFKKVRSNEDVTLFLQGYEDIKQCGNFADSPKDMIY